jgi:hypothetical protein
VDDTLQKAWINAASPFNGETACLPDLVPIEHLSGLLSVVVGTLRKEVECSSLAVVSDWHEHDGYISSSQSTDWQSLAELVASPTALYEQRPGDDFVRVAFFDRDLQFLLRVWIPDENDDPDQYPGRWGTFDLSGSSMLVRTIAHALPGDKLLFCDAKSFFDKRYAG